MAGGSSLLRLINDAIDFAKLEDGQLEFDQKPVNCADLLRRFADSFRNAKQIQTIEFRCRPSEMPTVLIDPKRIRQILFHLTDNAVKFTRQGFVEIRASFHKTADADTGTLYLEVEDSGCGISKEDLEKIDTPYAQVDSKQARHGGTGLGLAVCRKLAEAMDGQISVSSELGRGSLFKVTLFNVKVSDAEPVVYDEPLNIPAAATPANISPSAPSAEASEKKPEGKAVSKRVLLVDDQKVNLIVLKTMLKKLGTFDIVMAVNGQEALDILTSADTPFDLVLTDMWMPVMDGEGLVRAVRANERLSSLPIHVVTADTEMPGKFREIGFDGILLKPVQLEKLREVMG